MWTRFQAMGVLLAALSRTGWSSGLSLKSCEWQVMHVEVGGTPANHDFSTDVWQ